MFPSWTVAAGWESHLTLWMCTVYWREPANTDGSASVHLRSTWEWSAKLWELFDFASHWFHFSTVFKNAAVLWQRQTHLQREELPHHLPIRLSVTKSSLHPTHTEHQLPSIPHSHPCGDLQYSMKRTITAVSQSLKDYRWMTRRPPPLRPLLLHSLFNKRSLTLI